MSQPTNSRTRIIRRVDASGAGVTGKTTTDFTFFGFHKPTGGSAAAYTHGSAIATDLGNGYYAWTYNEPPTVGDRGLDVVAASGTDQVYVVAVSGEIEANDFDSTTNAAGSPTVTVANTGTVGQIVDLTIANKRHVVLTWYFKDAAGSDIDMTSGTIYSGYVFAVRSTTDQTLTPPKLDATNGSPAGFVIAAGVGYVSVTIPENASFFTNTEGASVTVDQALTLKYELTGDLVSTTETIALVKSSKLVLTRREAST